MSFHLKIGILFLVPSSMEDYSRKSTKLKEGNFLQYNALQCTTEVDILIKEIKHKKININYLSAFCSVRNDNDATGWTTARYLSTDIRTSVYTLACAVTTIIYCTCKHNKKHKKMRKRMIIMFIKLQKKI